jgi:hypothetical protein
MNDALSEKDKKIIQDVYVKCKGEVLKTIHEYDEAKDYFAWFEAIPLIMKAVEVYKVPGNRKSEIVVEVVCVIIEKDISVDNKEDLQGKIRSNAPKVIATIANASHYINSGQRIFKKIRKKISKYCSCCF